MWKIVFVATLVGLALAKEETLNRRKRQLFNPFLLLNSGFGGCIFSRNPWLCRETQFVPKIPINTLFNRGTPAPPTPVFGGTLINGLVNCNFVSSGSQRPGINCNYPTVNRAVNALNIFGAGLQATGPGGTPVVASGVNTGGAAVPSGVGATGPGGTPIASGTNAQGVNCAAIPPAFRAQSGCPVISGIIPNRILAPAPVAPPAPSPILNNVGISLQALRNALNVIRAKLNSRTTTVATPTSSG